MSGFLGKAVAKVIGRKLEEFRKVMTEAGLQKWTLNKYQTEYAIADPNMFNAHLLLENVLFTGATQFKVEELNFDVNTSELTCNLVIPRLFVNIGNLISKMTILHNECKGEVSGFVTILNLRVLAKMKLDMNQNGVDVDITSQKTSVDEIKSKVKMVLFGFDLSFLVENFLTNMLPFLLDSFMDYLKQPIEAALKFTFDRQFQDMF